MSERRQSAKRAPKENLRGQAWIIYDHVSSATAALQAEQGFIFFGRDLKLAYAKEKSDRVAKLDGTYVSKDRREKRAREEASAAVEASKKVKLETADPTAAETSVADPSSLVAEGSGVKSESTVTDGTPSNILFANSLPKDCNELMLSCLFRSYAGYKEVRIPRPGLAFIEFEEEAHATVALKALDGFSLSATEKLTLKYGKS